MSSRDGEEASIGAVPREEPEAVRGAQGQAHGRQMKKQVPFTINVLQERCQTNRSGEVGEKTYHTGADRSALTWPQLLCAQSKVVQVEYEEEAHVTT